MVAPGPQTPGIWDLGCLSQRTRALLPSASGTNWLLGHHTCELCLVPAVGPGPSRTGRFSRICAPAPWTGRATGVSPPGLSELERSMQRALHVGLTCMLFWCWDGTPPTTHTNVSRLTSALKNSFSPRDASSNIDSFSNNGCEPFTVALCAPLLTVLDFRPSLEVLCEDRPLPEHHLTPVGPPSPGRPKCLGHPPGGS